jgi:hypothetical protein
MKTWIELTYANDRKGFTKFLRAPLKNKGGSSFVYYDNVLQVKKGDRIYHIDLEIKKILGYSYAFNDGEIKNERYKVDLEKYFKLEKSISTKELFNLKKIELNNFYMKNKNSKNHRSLFYRSYGDTFRCTNGGYLSELSNELHEIIFGEEFVQSLEDKDKIPNSTKTTINRRIRDTEIIRELKEKYNNKCQICGKTLMKSYEANYSEGHHLHPLGENGPDVKGNIIILCPNHHAEFDYKTVAINPISYKIEHIDNENEFNEKLAYSLNENHLIKEEYLKYHYKRFKEKQ